MRVSLHLAVVGCIATVLVSAAGGAPVAQQLSKTDKGTAAANPQLKKWFLSNDTKCQVCMLITDILEAIGDSEAAEEDVARYLVQPLCTIQTDYDEYVCNLTVEEFKVL